MPNNLVVDISSINYAISRITNIQNKLNSSNSIVNGQKTSFTNVDATNVSQLKIFAKSFSSKNKNFTASPKKDKGNAMLTGTIFFDEIGFSQNPVVCITLDVPTSQKLICFVHQKDNPNNVDFTIIKTDGNDWGTNKSELNFNINVIAIGYGA